MPARTNEYVIRCALNGWSGTSRTGNLRATARANDMFPGTTGNVTLESRGAVIAAFWHSSNGTIIFLKSTSYDRLIRRHLDIARNIIPHDGAHIFIVNNVRNAMESPAKAMAESILRWRSYREHRGPADLLRLFSNAVQRNLNLASEQIIGMVAGRSPIQVPWRIDPPQRIDQWATMPLTPEGGNRYTFSHLDLSPTPPVRPEPTRQEAIAAFIRNNARNRQEPRPIRARKPYAVLKSGHVKPAAST